MEVNLEIKGKQNFMGIDIPIVEGGFGVGKRSITDKMIGKTNKQPPYEIRRRINDNIDKFIKGKDYLDLKVMGKSHNNLDLLLSLGYTKMEISKAKNIYLLSERGYLKLVKIMNTDRAWDIYENLLDEYFTLKQIVNDKERLLADTFYKSIFADSEEERTINTRIFGELKEEYGREKQREEDERFLIEERKESYLSTINMLKEVDKNIFSKGFFQSLENKGYGKYVLVRKKVRFISNDKFENDFVKSGLCRRSVNYVYTWNPLMIDYILNNENDNGLYESSLKLTKIMLNENYEVAKKKKMEQENKGTTIKQTYKTINKLCKLEFTEKTFIKFLININWINSNKSATTYAKENGYAYKYRDYTKITKEGLEKLINMFYKGEF